MILVSGNTHQLELAYKSLAPLGTYRVVKRVRLKTY